jgi:hypothetical protein
MCITAMRATKNLNTLNPASAGIIGNIQVSLHLDHVSAPLFKIKTLPSRLAAKKQYQAAFLYIPQLKGREILTEIAMAR